MKHNDDARILSYVSLIFAGALATQSGLLGFSFVLIGFVLFHVIGKALSGTKVSVSPAIKLMGFLLVVLGPWFGLFAFMLLGYFGFD